MEAFEGSKDMFKSLGEKAKTLGKVVLKEAKKAAGIHVGQVSESNPRYYIVVAPQGAMVRKDIELDSVAVHGLRRGDLVTCVDISGRRARIIDPVDGWVSIRTNENETILEMTIAPDKRTQVSQMERRFEKLKAEQRVGEQANPVPNEPAASDSDSTAPANVAVIKTKLSFKSSPDSSLIGTSDAPAVVPKLSGPMKRPLPVSSGKSSTPADLFSFDSPKAAKQAEAAPSSSATSLPVPMATHVGVTKTSPWADPFADIMQPQVPRQAVAPATAKPTQGPSVVRTAQPPKDDLNDWFN